MTIFAKNTEQKTAWAGTETAFYTLGAILLIMLLLAPTLSIIGQIPNIGVPWSKILSMEQRTVVLLVRTITLAAAASITSILLGTALAFTMRFWSQGQGVLFGLLLLAFPIPPYIHTAGWSLALQDLGINSHSIPVAWWCMSMSLLPLSAIAVYAIIESIDEELLEAASLLNHGPQCLGQIILPLSLPLMVGAMLLLFCLNVLDYTIPSLCQVNVYALRIFADFSLFAQPGRSFILSLPLLLASLPLFLWAGLRFNQIGTSMKPKTRYELRLQWPFTYFLGAGLALFIFGVGLVIPLAILFKQAWQAGMTQHFFKFFPALGYSFFVALAVCLLSVLIGYPAAVLMTEKSLGRAVIWPLLVLPWIVPSSLNGVGWIAAANQIPFLSGSTFLLILGETTRFVSVAVLLIWGFRARIDRELINAARLISPSWLKTVLKVELPLVLPGILAGSFMVTALTLGELGTAVILSPPGWETLTIRIYNYLHYGAKGHVAVACLTMMVLTMFLGYAARRAFTLARDNTT